MHLAPGPYLAGNICHPVNRAEQGIEECAAVVEAAIAQVGYEQGSYDQRNGEEPGAEMGFFDE